MSAQQQRTDSVSQVRRELAVRPHGPALAAAAVAELPGEPAVGPVPAVILIEGNSAL
jgi:hypothetical protein